jgi:acetyl esterase
MAKVMQPDRRRFMQLAGLATLGSAVGVASGQGTDASAGSNTDAERLQKPVRAAEPTPEVQELLDTLAAQNVPHLNELTTQQARQLYEKFFIEPPEEEVGRVANREVSGPNGSIPIRIYWPKESSFNEPLPVSVYMHGGGWVLGGLDTHDSVARSLTNASEAMVVSIDYRLAPEHTFPAAVEDCWAVTKWVANNASSMEADPNRMAVTGESAGGDMTAVMTFLAQGNDAVNFVHQLPIYPVTDLSGRWQDELPDTFSILAPESEQQLDRRYLVTKDLPWFANRYLPYKYAANNLYTSPLLANEELLSGLPPATVVTTGFGPLGDQGYLYAKNLQEAGVPVEVTHYPAMIHDFFNMEHLTDPYPDLPTAGKAKRKAGQTLRAAFERANQGADTPGEVEEDDDADDQYQGPGDDDDGDNVDADGDGAIDEDDEDMDDDDDSDGNNRDDDGDGAIDEDDDLN